jgi:glutamine synthetase
MSKKPADVLETIAKNGVRTVDLRYADRTGAWRSAIVPAERFDTTAFGDGVRLDAGVRLVPDPNAAYLDPFRGMPALIVVCDRVDASGGCPRSIAKRAESASHAGGWADAVRVAAEIRYYVVDARTPGAHDAPGRIACGSELDDVRDDALATLAACGLDVAAQRENASEPAQTILVLANAGLVAAADAAMLAKSIVKRAAERRGLAATFMALPFFGRAPSGAVVAVGALKGARSPFYDKDGWACASQTALFFAGGVLAHADSLLALCAPATNSFRRFAAGDVPTVALGAGAANTAAAVVAHGDKTPFVEFRAGDCTANPYLAYAAILCAGLDGVARRIDPISAGYGPVEAAAPRRKSGPAPRALVSTLGAALDALERDDAYLCAGEVFGKAFIREWIEAKRNAAIAVESRPHGFEIATAFDG